jgi:ribosomal protein S18 acetylase RimI-like enzyme
MPSAIIVLSHQELIVAREIIELMHRSYRIEGALLGIDDFPPLRRRVEDVQGSSSAFVGVMGEVADALAGVCEYRIDAGLLDIHSLVVDPILFRTGIAARLMHHMLGLPAWSRARVETATANEPALALYQRFEFRPQGHRHTAEDIPIVTLVRDRVRGDHCDTSVC